MSSLLLKPIMPLHITCTPEFILILAKPQIKAINDYGLVGYVQRGGELPSSDFIDAYHQHIKTFYTRNKSTLNLNGSYRGERAIIIHNDINGEVLIFRADTKQL